MENNHTSHTSFTQCPENAEWCCVCDGELPAGTPRVFRVEIPDGVEEHVRTFRHVECWDRFKKGKEAGNGK